MVIKKDFFQRFRDFLLNAKIVDSTYPVQNYYLLLPYGLELLNYIFNNFRKVFKSEFDAQEVDLPLALPSNLLGIHSPTKVTKDNPDFSNQIPLKTIGSNNVNPPLLRGALDLPIYSYLKHAITSYKHLPMCLTTQGKVIRNDSGHILIRDPEINFYEGIIVCRENEVDFLFEKIKNVMIDTFLKLEIPVRPLIKPDFAERFVENRTIKLFSTIPEIKSVYSVGIIHYFHNHPTSFFNININNPDNGMQEHPVVFNFAISQRSLFAFLVNHMDDIGFVIPPYFDISTGVILMRFTNEQEKHTVEEYSSKLVKETKESLKLQIKNAQTTIKKEIKSLVSKGYPFRIDIGPKEVANNTVTLYIRLTNKKLTLSQKELTKMIKQEIFDAQSNSQEILNSKIIKLHNWDDGLITNKYFLCNECQEEKEKFERVLGHELNEYNSKELKQCQNCKKFGSKIVFTGDLL